MGTEIACLITEASPGNMGVVPPLPGFNEFLAQTCAKHGALFVSDEVMTGFRVSRRGQWGLDGAVEGWSPDLVTFGKVMGGGFPAAAFGGRADVMAMLSPDGPVYQAGTLSGNPIATTAGLTTLRLATDEVYAHIDASARTLSAAVGEELTRAGVPHVVQAGGNMFSVFLGLEGDTRARLRSGLAPGHGCLQGVLPRHARPGRLPAAQRLRGLVPLRRPRRPGAAARHRRPARGRRGSGTSDGERPVKTIVHLLRHGEVHNPQGILYGRSTGFHLSERGRRMANRVADRIGDRDITYIVSSPLERAQETATPLAATLGLTVELDERVVESGNIFEGKPFNVRRSILRSPEVWTKLWNPFLPSWGEPYKQVVGRMWPAVHDARETAAGHEAVIVSHQLPIWITRLDAEGRPFLHDPRKRHCTLCSLTSFTFEDDRLVSVGYSEPAGDLIPLADRGAPFSAGWRRRGTPSSVRSDRAPC